MLVGDPSSGKSPALDALLDPVREIDSALGAEYQIERQAWADQEEIARLVLAQWKPDAKMAIQEGGEAPEKPKEACAGQPPVRGRIRITDATTEKVGELMRETGGADCCYAVTSSQAG